MWYFFSTTLSEFGGIPPDKLVKMASSKCEQVCKIAESQVHVG